MLSMLKLILKPDILVSTSAHDNYMSLKRLPLSLQNAPAGWHLLRSMKLYWRAVMELLADNTLSAYYSRPIRSQRAMGEKQKEREKERERGR